MKTNQNYNMNMIRAIILAFSLLAGVSAGAYTQLAPLHHYLPQDGLAQRQVWTIFQDSSGAIWFGTKGGVTRFNGHDMISLTVNDGLISNHVEYIAEGPGLTIYLLMADGINRVENMKITGEWLLEGYTRPEMPLIDERGHLMFTVNNPLTDLSRIYRVAGDSLVVVLDSLPAGHQLLRDPVSAKLIVSEGMHHSFSLFEHDSLVPIPNQPQFSHLLLELPFNRKTRLEYQQYVGTNTWARIAIFPSLVGNILVYKANEGWYLCNPSEKTKLYLLQDEHELGPIQIPFPFHYIACLFLDRDNQLWVATEKGAIRFEDSPFKLYKNIELLRDPWSLVEDSQGRIWVGNYGTGIALIAGDSVSEVPVPPLWKSPEKDEHARKHIYSGGILGPGDEVLFNTSRGLIAHRNGRFRLLFESEGDSPLYGSWNDTLQKRMIFSVFMRGLWVYHSDGSVKQITPNPEPAFARIYSLTADRYNRFWVGSDDTLGLFEGDVLTSIDTHYPPVQGGAYAMVKDEQGNLWMGNDHGLHQFDYEQYKQIIDPRLNSPVYDLEVLPGNRLLIGSSRGVGVLWLDSYYQSDSLLMKWYDYRTGWPGGEVKINGFTRARDGRIWIASSEGVVVMDPDRIRFDRRNITAEFTELSCLCGNHEWTNWFDPGLEKIKLTHQHNSVKIRFNSIDVVAPEYQVFRYRLMPLDKNWHQDEGHNELVFRDLRPKKYELQLAYKSPDGPWNPHPTSLTFEIRPGFHQTVWFLIAVVLVTIGLVVFLTANITRYLEREKRRKLEMDRELADLRLKTFRNQMDPHFTFNALNSIGYAIQQKQPEVAYDYLAKFSKLVRMLLKNSELNFIRLEEELQFISNYLEIEKFRYEERLHYSISIDPRVDLNREIPKMLIQIHAENAIKHGLMLKHEGGVLSIRLIQKKNGVIIEIEDNGVGRTSANKISTSGIGVGLKLVDQMMSLINETQQNAITHEIIDLVDADKNPIGTLIRIKLKAF